MAVCRCPVRFIVYYAQKNSKQWIVECTEDGSEVARGTLAEMMALVTGPDAKYPGRRAHYAEDMLRFKPTIFEMEFQYPVTLPGR
jgi:hypothetical protein